MVAGTRSSPPPLPRGVSRSRVPAVLWWAVGVVLAAFAASSIMAAHLPLPGCGFKGLTGLPCPGCGGTRSLAALGHLKPGDSFFWNPLLAVTAFAVLASVPLALLDRIANGGRISALLQRRVPAKRHLAWLLAGLLGLNWIYLIAALP